MEKTEKETPRARRRVGKIVLIVLAAIIVPVLVLAGLVIGRVQEPRIATTADEAENRHMVQAVSKLANAMITPEGKIAKIATVPLKPEEVDALMAAGIRAYQFRHHGDDDPVCFAAMQNGAVRAEVSLPIGAGFAVNAAAHLRPRLAEGGALTVQIGGLRAGWLPLPGRLAEKIAERLIAELAQEPEYQKATEIVKEASLQADGTLVVTFVPTKIPSLLALLMQGR